MYYFSDHTWLCFINAFCVGTVRVDTVHVRWKSKKDDFIFPFDVFGPDNHRGLQLRRKRFYHTLAIVLELEPNKEVEVAVEAEFLENIVVELDYTANLPDECLASIFHFLSSSDRKQCSLVCHRWFRVDGQNRHRFSLNARAYILYFLPSLFTRFDSMTNLALLRCNWKSNSLNDDALVLISIRCRSLTRLKLRGCRELTKKGVAEFAKNCTGLKKLSVGLCMFGACAMNAILDHCTALEELYVKRLKGLNDSADPIAPAQRVPRSNPSA
ncbi:hypothetical protein FH972_017653 [Carpinus fangiana]|uniref:F-box domain-containing protein n=1 Tax=Carpinus fangiana TaxID=176857 RepID=A0A5N6RN05_9ROSI|nr:hypothetical protein FH972_017653 [Carpinus fangiana]